MFTGIVEEVGIVKEVHRNLHGGILTITAPSVLADSEVGDSIAIDGVCLTMARVECHNFTADISAETLRCTTLESRRPGDRVNLERSLRLCDRLGGHLVLGHVDDVGMISKWYDEGASSLIRISASPDVVRYVVYKGSVCIDGISLTISNLFDNEFEIALIPHTKRVTTIGGKRVGERVNIEVDLLGRYVERLLADRTDTSHATDFGFLKTHGYTQ